MGTRHLVCVVKNQKFCAAQYGHWEGYPEGAGATIVGFLLHTDLERFKTQVDKIQVVKDDYGSDPGAEILHTILYESNPVCVLNLNFAADGLFCDYAYVVDLDQDQLELYVGGWRGPLALNERFAFLNEKSERGWSPVKHALTIPFTNLGPASVIEMQQAVHKFDEEAEKLWSTLDETQS